MNVHWRIGLCGSAFPVDQLFFVYLCSTLRFSRWDIIRGYPISIHCIFQWWYLHNGIVTQEPLPGHDNFLMWDHRCIDSCRLFRLAIELLDICLLQCLSIWSLQHKALSGRESTASRLFGQSSFALIDPPALRGFCPSKRSPQILRPSPTSTTIKSPQFIEKENRPNRNAKKDPANVLLRR